MSDPSGPIENGITYIVRPRMQPSKSPVEDVVHLAGAHPVVGGPSVLRGPAADVRPVLDASDIAGIGPRQEAVGPFVRVQPDEGSRLDELLAQLVVLLVGTVAPVDGSRFAQGGHLGRPGLELGVSDGGGGFHGTDPRARLVSAGRSRGGRAPMQPLSEQKPHRLPVEVPSARTNL